MTTKSTASSIAHWMRLSNADRVADRISSTGSPSYRDRPCNGLSKWMSAACRKRKLDTVMFPPGSQCRSEEHTSELQSLMRISYAVFCLKKKKHNKSEQK